MAAGCPGYLAGKGPVEEEIAEPDKDLVNDALDLLQGMGEVFDQILDVLYAHAQPNE